MPRPRTHGSRGRGRPPRAAPSEDTPTTPDNDNLRLEDLRSRVDAARQRIEERALQRQLQTLHEQEAALNRDNDTDSTAAPRRDDPTSQERRPAAPTSTHPTSIKPRDVPPYKGKTIREHQRFRTAIELAHRLLRIEDDGTRINHALQYVECDARDLWMDQQDAGERSAATWTQFLEFLLDQIKSPEFRQIDIAMRYSRAMQKPDQTVQAFATYLHALEIQIQPPFAEEHLAMTFFTKLRPEIRTAITNNSTSIPMVRREMVDKAIVVEQGLKQATSSMRPGLRQPRDSESKDRQATKTQEYSHDQPQDERHTDSGLSRRRCSYCKKPGHESEDCWTRKRDGT